MEVEIKREELYKMYDGSVESILEVFDAFLDSETEVLEELEIAFSNESEKLIRQQLHYHAPVFGYVGFPQVVLFLKALENKYSNPIAVAEMQRDYAEIRAVLKKVTAILAEEKEHMKTAVHA
jgi:hypothetical protein